MIEFDILIPTCERPAALAVTLTSLAAQPGPGFRIVLSDQSEGEGAMGAGEVQAVVRLLRAQGRPVEYLRHLPRRGMAEQRQFLLDQAGAPYALFLDDDVIVSSGAPAAMLRAIREEGCGFVGRAVVGLSFLDDVRPHEQAIEFWDGPVTPEYIEPDSPAWDRHRLHNAANLYHLQCRLGLHDLDRQRKYRVAWVGGCVLYDTVKLREVGGFGFWRQLPAQHAGEDVLAQLRLMARYGGCGLIPSAVYHQELPTTIRERPVDAPRVLPITGNPA